MTTRQALCALDLAPADLSAWRSHALPDEEYRRISQHAFSGDPVACKNHARNTEFIDCRTARRPRQPGKADALADAR